MSYVSRLGRWVLYHWEAQAETKGQNRNLPCSLDQQRRWSCCDSVLGSKGPKTDHGRRRPMRSTWEPRGGFQGGTPSVTAFVGPATGAENRSCLFAVGHVPTTPQLGPARKEQRCTGGDAGRKGASERPGHHPQGRRLGHCRIQVGRQGVSAGS